MGSSSESSPQGAPAPGGSPAKHSAPELLARLVVRCRDLDNFLQAAAGKLPDPKDSPFLFRQLEDVVGRLQRALHGLGLTEQPEEPGKEERGGFLGLFSGKKRKATPTYPLPRAATMARYDLQGSAWTIPVTELVGFLSQSGKSGVLWVTTSSETFVLEFTRGSLVHATSNAPPRAFRLGEILIRDERIEREALDREIERARSSEEFLGSHLVRAGLVSKEALQRALAIQVQELFHRLMDAENATYGFQEGLQLLRAQSLEVNITHLLLESARKKDEARMRAQPRSNPPPLAFLDLERTTEGGPEAEAASDEPPAGPPPPESSADSGASVARPPAPSAAQEPTPEAPTPTPIPEGWASIGPPAPQPEPRTAASEAHQEPPAALPRAEKPEPRASVGPRPPAAETGGQV